MVGTRAVSTTDFYLNRSESSLEEEGREQEEDDVDRPTFRVSSVPLGGNCVLLFTRGIVVDSMPVDSVMMIPPVETCYLG